MKCPREDPQNLRTEDIFEVKCPHCPAIIEFWKNDHSAKCPKCKEMVKNPNTNS